MTAGRRMLAAWGAAAAVAGVAAQAPFATQVVGFQTNGNAGGGIFNPPNALGAPQGALDVHSLGIGGELTLGLQTAITDGPGADFLVGENPFRLAGAADLVFAEVMFVEVSSNGVDFARFPASYYGPATQPGPFGAVVVGSYSGLAGQTPVLLPSNPGADPQDVVEAGGDAFDLRDLAQHPLVLQQLVDLTNITQVRLVDVVSGQSLDHRSRPIFDPGSGSADVDAITVVHQRGSVSQNGPSVELEIHMDGTARLRLEDPDGWSDLDPGSFRAALYGIPVPAAALFGSLQLVQADANGFTLVQPVPLPSNLLFTVAFALKDQAGHRSGQSRARPAN
ncbi:MAG: hypothetical protein KDE27_10605 [Planctomycetes bacterium]|nr:hypothetical protein [Planctomycetota bacterium]